MPDRQQTPQVTPQAQPARTPDAQGGADPAASRVASAQIAAEFGGKESKPEIDASTEAMGAHVVADMNQANGQDYGLTTGIHYQYNYRRELEETIAAAKGADSDAADAKAQLAASPIKEWTDDHRGGYANPKYFTKKGWMSWELNAGMSASAAIRAWLTGLTIAECNSCAMAIEIDTMRAAMGDDAFDHNFGGKNGKPAIRLMCVSSEGAVDSPVNDVLVETAASHGDAGSIGKRPVNKGDWYYFYNHPKYLLKHPGGAWQGENSIYMGEEGGQQLWAGLGASNVTEDGMYDEMVRAYNADRSRDDLQAIDGIKSDNNGKLPAEYDTGGFPDTIDKQAILTAPPTTIGGTTRKGGFNLAAGQALDPAAVKKLRDGGAH